MTTVREASWLMSAGKHDADPAALRAKAAPALDWGHLVVRAEYERAFPVVADRLRDAALEIPSDVAAQLRSRAMVAEFAIGRLHATLDQAVATLARGEIQVLLLKGAALSRTRYPSRRLRPMGDMDLLVKPEELRRAYALLLEAGWQVRHDPALEEFYDQHHHLAPMHDPRGAGAKLELHRDLFTQGHPFAFGAPAVWRDAQPVEVAGTTAWVPSPEHLLLHCCIHFSWGHLMLEGAWTTFRDVGVLSRAPDLDWDRFVDTAIAARAATACYWTMSLAHRLMGASVPAGALQRLTPGLPAPVLERLARHFGSRVLGARRAPDRIEHAIWELAMRPRRCGHGAVRPWDHDDDFVPSQSAVGAPAESALERTRRHWKELQDSTRCLADLALGRSGMD